MVASDDQALSRYLMMNLNKWLIVSRLTCALILIFTLSFVTFVQVKRYSEANTRMSISYVERNLELPSFTLCPMYAGKTDNNPENITFKDYMEGVLKASDFFEWAAQNIVLPGKK